MSEPKAVYCAAVMVRRPGKILLGRRAKRYGRGEWQIPGGECEAGELKRPSRAAARELREETGLRCNERDMVYITNVYRHDPVDNISYHTYIYEVWNFTGNPVNREPEKNDGWMWFDLYNLPRNLFEINGVMDDYLLRISA